jgi:hypothetical protein
VQGLSRVYAAWVDESDRRATDTIAGIVPRPDPAASRFDRSFAERRGPIDAGVLQPPGQLAWHIAGLHRPQRALDGRNPCSRQTAANPWSILVS